MALSKRRKIMPSLLERVAELRKSCIWQVGCWFQITKQPCNIKACFPSFINWGSVLVFYPFLCPLFSFRVSSPPCNISACCRALPLLCCCFFTWNNLKICRATPHLKYNEELQSNISSLAYSPLLTYYKNNLVNVFRNIIGTRHVHLVHCQFVVSIRTQLLLKLLI